MSLIRPRLPGPRIAAFTALLLTVIASAETRRPDHRPAAVTPLPRTLSLADLSSACSAAKSPTCELTIDSPVLTDLDHDATLSHPLSISILDGGSWTIRGATLDLAGSTIDAPADRRVIFGSGHLSGLASARPEWFSEPVAQVYPRAALQAAYAAVSRSTATSSRAAATTHGTILLTNHAYISPFFDPASPGSCSGAAIDVNDTLSVAGTTRPLPDSPNQPTRLVNGSVIQGEICGTGVLHLSHLGVDEGPYVVSHNFGGHPSFGIQLASTGRLGASQGTSLDDISVLTNGMKDQHSVIIEGQGHASIRHLWIWSLGGTHGLVLKSFASTVDDFHCAGAAANCLIVKSDFATDHAGEASDASIRGVFISPLAHPGDTGGIELEGRWDSLRRVRLTDVHEQGLTFGIAMSDSLLHTLSDVTIQNWSALNMTGPCLVAAGGQRISIDNFQCSILPQTRGAALTLATTDTTLRNGSIQCAGTASACRRLANDGIDDLGRRNTVENVQGDQLGGFLLRSSLHRGGTRQLNLNTVAMGQRVSAPYQPPASSLRADLNEQIRSLKGLLRILWTQVATDLGPRVALALVACVFLLAAGTVLSAILHGRRRSRSRAAA